MNSVRSRSSFASSARIACGMRRVEDVEASRCRTAARSTSGASDEPPMPSSTTSSIGAATSSASASTGRRPRASARGSSSQPSQRPRPRRSRRSGRAPRCARRARALGRQRARQLARAWRGCPAISSSNASANFCTPSASSVCDDVVVVDARRARARRAAARASSTPSRTVSPRTSPWSWNASTRLERHRVHGVGADQLLDVHHVAVGRVLGRGRRPERPLHGRARRGERLPARAREGLLEVPVRELRVRDPELALQLLVAERLEPVVGLGVDARDEERRDRRDLRRVAAALDAAARARAGRPRRPRRSAPARRSA